MSAHDAFTPPDDEAALRVLALRLLIPRAPGTVSASAIQLLPGQLPPDLPFALLLPDGSRIASGIVYRWRLAGPPTKGAISWKCTTS